MKTLENLPTEIIFHILFLLKKNLRPVFFTKNLLALRRTSKALKEKTDAFLFSKELKYEFYLSPLRSLLKSEINASSMPDNILDQFSPEIYASLYYSAIRGEDYFWTLFNEISSFKQQYLLIKPSFFLTSNPSSYVVPLLPLLAYYGHLHFISTLEKRLPEKVDYQEMLAWDGYDSFYRGCVKNNIDVVALLFNQCLSEKRQKMLRGPKKNPYVSFEATANSWNKNLLKLLLHLCEPTQHQKMLNAGGYIAFCCACINNDEELIDLFLKICEPKKFLKMLTTSNHTPLRWALRYKELSIIKKIFFLYPPEMRQLTLEKIVGTMRHLRSPALCHFLVNQWNNPEILPFYHRGFFSILATCTQDESLFDKVVKKAPTNLLQDFIHYEFNSIFSLYCGQGKSGLIKKLFLLCDPHHKPRWASFRRQPGVVQLSDFSLACESDDFDTIKTILELGASDKKQKMITYSDYYGFRTVCYNENLMAAALIFFHANEMDLDNLKKIAQDFYPKKTRLGEAIKDKAVITNLNFLLFYRYFMESILDNKKITWLTPKNAELSCYSRITFFKENKLVDNTKPEPYHTWAITKLYRPPLLACSG